MGIPKNDALAALEKVIGRYQDRIEAALELKKELEGAKTEVVIEPGRYKDSTKSDAIQDFLRRRGEAATLEEIGQALVQGECNLGGAGLKYVKTTITMNKAFVTNGDLVGLREWRERAA